jgi:hypothetical protein
LLRLASEAYRIRLGEQHTRSKRVLH